MSAGLSPSDGLVALVPQTLLDKSFKHRIRFAGIEHTAGHGSRPAAGGTGSRAAPDISRNRTDGRTGRAADGRSFGGVFGDPAAPVFPGAIVDGHLDAFFRIGLSDLLSNVL